MGEMADSDIYKVIGKNMSVFLESYIPDKLPYREEEIKKIERILYPIIFNNPTSNIIVMGKTGTGKTVVVKKVCSNIQEKSKKEGRALNVQYINCSEIDNIMSLFTSLSSKLEGNTGIHIPPSGWAFDKVIEKFKELLKKRNESLIIILDEIDKMIHRIGDSPLYTLINLSNESPNYRVNIIGITNDVNLPSIIVDERVKSRLNDEKITFAPYNAPQLVTILTDRAKIAFEEGSLDENVISVCAAIGAHEHGDARRALNLLRMATQIAERNGKSKVEVEDVYTAKKTIESDYIEQILNGLPLHQKLIMYSIVKVMEKTNSKIVKTPDVIEFYISTTLKMDMTPLSPRRINDLINDLSTLGLINTQLRYYGRKGRIKEIDLWVPKPNVINMVETDETLKNYIASRPNASFQQKTLV